MVDILWPLLLLANQEENTAYAYIFKAKHSLIFLVVFIEPFLHLQHPTSPLIFIDKGVKPTG